MANPLRKLRLPGEEDPRNLLRLLQPEQLEPSSTAEMPEPPVMTNPLRASMGVGGGDETAPINLPPMSGVEMIRAGGRPLRSAMSDSIAREDDYQQQLSEYKPRNEGLGKTILRSAMGLMAGPAQAISPWLNRDREDDQWRNREMARSGQMSDRMGVQALRQSQISENQAQTEKARRGDEGKYDWFPQDVDGDGIPDTETYGQVGPGSSKQVFRKAASERVPLQKEVSNADGSKRVLQSFDMGKTWQEAPDLASQAPAAKPEKPDKPIADFKRRADWYYKKQVEAESLAADLRQQADKSDTSSFDGQTAKADLLKRASEAESRAATMRDKGDEAATAPEPQATPRGQGAKPAKDGKYHYTPAQIKAQAEAAGMSYDEVVKKLQAHPSVVIDQ